MFNRIVIYLFFLTSGIVFTAYAHASCTKTAYTQTEDGRTAIIPFGKLNLADTYLQPVGTLLASVVVPSTNYTYGGTVASTVLWECDAVDLPSIYFLVATNGDDRVGGYYESGADDGLPSVYATWFAYTGIKLTMSGTTLSRYWQKVPITTYATASSGKIQIRLQDIPPLQAELYRISSLPGTSARSAYCGNSNSGSGIGYASTSGKNYTCTQPNGYIQLSGDSSVSFSFARDAVGDDSSTNFNFFLADNGFGYGMRSSNTLYQTATCVVRNATPVVLLPMISVPSLNAGQTVSANFSVEVECSNAAVSGVAANQTAIGFQASDGAYAAARTIGLVNSSGGVSALLSDNFGSSGVAGGVGIYLYNSLGTNMVFLGNSGNVSLTSPGGSSAGWYPVLDGATSAGSSSSGYTNYSQTFTATLGRLPGQTVSAGKVYSTSYVLVKIQ